MRLHRIWRGIGSVALAVAPALAGRRAVAASSGTDWNQPSPPFRIVANVYYVGSAGLASYLITTPEGHILINSDLESTVPLIRANVEALGFKLSDVKVLLISHAHWDHAGGSALIKRLTGATYMVMDADVPVVESGGKEDFHYGRSPEELYEPARVDRVLHDGDRVAIGGTVLTAHRTAGHTPGCTTWTLRVEEDAKLRDVVIVGSVTVNDGYRLVGNTRYPSIARDYEATFGTLEALPCDYFLGAHGSSFDLAAKVARLKARDRNAFVDPAGYARFVKQMEQAFRSALEKQQTPALR